MTQQEIDSSFTVEWDSKSEIFSFQMDLNKHVVEMYEQFLNDKLRIKGHLFLNEALDEFDIPRERIGQTHGWVWKKFQPGGLVKIRLATRDSKVFVTFNTDGDIMNQVWSEV